MSFNANALLDISGQYNDDNNSNFWTLFCSIIICSKTGWHTDRHLLYILFLFFLYIFNILYTCPIVTGSHVHVLLYFTIGHFLRLLKREQFAFFSRNCILLCRKQWRATFQCCFTRRKRTRSYIWVCKKVDLSCSTQKHSTKSWSEHPVYWVVVRK